MASMIAKRMLGTVITVAGLLFAPMSALAQSTAAAPPHVPLQKVIGQAKPDIVPSLIVMNRAARACRVIS